MMGAQHGQRLRDADGESSSEIVAPAFRSLHPEAINALIDSFRDFAPEHSVSVVFATHSPVVLDAFREVPDQVFVMDPTEASLPVRPTAIKVADWLKHFSLGDLCKHREFGARGTAR